MARWSKKHTAVAAGASVTNATTLAGQVGNPPTRPSAMQLRATASGDTVLVTAYAGERVIVQEQELSSANRFPILGQDEVGGPVGVMPLEAVSLTFRNASAAARDIYWSVDLVPVG